MRQPVIANAFEKPCKKTVRQSNLRLEEPEANIAVLNFRKKGFVERLIDVDVSQTGHPALIQKDRLHGRRAAGDCGPKAFQRQVRVDRLRTKAGEERCCVIYHTPGAELAQVGPSQVVPIVQDELRTLPLLGRRRRFAPKQPARHSQMDDQRPAVIHAEQDVLPAAAHGGKRPPDEARA